MGQKKFVAIDLSQEEEQEQEYKPEKTKTESAPKTDAPAVAPESKEKKKEAKPVLSESGSPAVVLSKAGKDMSHLVEEEPKESKKVRPAQKEVTKKPSSRSRRYEKARALVDRTITYPLNQAVELLKKTSVARFDASVEAHLNVTETGLKAEIQFPHSTGRTTKVAITDDKILENIAAGKIDFDVLLATPEMMPKLAKLAKILGPKGLMPNPKSGTITQDPEKKKQEMEGGKTLVRTEPKAPLVHTVVGKISLKDTELSANITALINGLLPKNILKLTLSSTMGPGIKVNLEEFKQ